jgi:hypothetical protein
MQNPIDAVIVSIANNYFNAITFDTRTQHPGKFQVGVGQTWDKHKIKVPRVDSSSDMLESAIRIYLGSQAVDYYLFAEYETPISGKVKYCKGSDYSQRKNVPGNNEFGDRTLTITSNGGLQMI